MKTKMGMNRREGNGNPKDVHRLRIVGISAAILGCLIMFQSVGVYCSSIEEETGIAPDGTTTSEVGPIEISGATITSDKLNDLRCDLGPYTFQLRDRTCSLKAVFTKADFSDVKGIVTLERFRAGKVYSLPIVHGQIQWDRKNNRAALRAHSHGRDHQTGESFHFYFIGYRDGNSLLGTVVYHVQTAESDHYMHNYRGGFYTRGDLKYPSHTSSISLLNFQQKDRQGRLFRSNTGRLMSPGLEVFEGKGSEQRTFVKRKDGASVTNRSYHITFKTNPETTVFFRSVDETSGAQQLNVKSASYKSKRLHLYNNSKQQDFQLNLVYQTSGSQEDGLSRDWAATPTPTVVP